MQTNAIFISTHNRFDLPGNTIFEITRSLNQANYICRQIKLLNDFIPVFDVVGTISSLAVGVFLGAPFFILTAVATVSIVGYSFHQLNRCSEDIQSISNYFALRTFKLDDCDFEVALYTYKLDNCDFGKVQESFEFGYVQFVLVQKKK